MHKELINSIPDDLLTKQDDGCWVWWGPCSKEGAPLVSVDVTGKKRRLTRVMWEWRHKKPLPEEKRIWIKCKNACCVNPDHLEAETYHQMMSRKKVDRRLRGGTESVDSMRDDPAAVRRVLKELKPRQYYK